MTPPHSSESLKGKQFLLVEDSIELTDVMLEFFEEIGADVLPVITAGEALEVLRSRSFDLLICNILLPDGDGYSLIRKVHGLEKEQGKTPTPAIALTAQASPADMQRSLDAGFRHHLSKPFEIGALISLLTSLIISNE